MFENLKAYLTQQGFKYIKPEKAGSLAEEMIALKTLGQSARAEFTEIAKVLALKVSPFEMMRVSNWANQAQVARPHFWCYYKQPEDNQDDVGLAIRLYGNSANFGISVEVSFIERKKSKATLAKQHKVLDIPIAEPRFIILLKRKVKVIGFQEQKLIVRCYGKKLLTVKFEKFWSSMTYLYQRDQI